jgi:hypothetical protein
MDAADHAYEPSRRGGFHTAPVLGEGSAVAASYQLRWLELFRSLADFAVRALLCCLLAAMAFSMTLFDRSDGAYSWMGTVFLAEAALAAFFIFSVSTQHLSIQSDMLFVDFLLPLIYAGWVMVWWVWFRMQRPAWLPRVVVGLIVISVFAAPIGEDLFFNVFPHSVAVAFLTVVLILPVLFFSLQLWIVILGIRGQRLEGWLVLPSVVLLGIIRFCF